MALWLSAKGVSGGVAIGRVFKGGGAVTDLAPPRDRAETVLVAAGDDQDAAVILVCSESEQAYHAHRRGHKFAAIVTESDRSLLTDAVQDSDARLTIVAGAKNATEILTEGEWLVVNGQTGDLIASPDEEALAYYREKRNESDGACAP